MPLILLLEGGQHILPCVKRDLSIALLKNKRDLLVLTLREDNTFCHSLREENIFYSWGSRTICWKRLPLSQQMERERERRRENDGTSKTQRLR
jgi:hypothetical protein